MAQEQQPEPYLMDLDKHLFAESNSIMVLRVFDICDLIT